MTEKSPLAASWIKLFPATGLGYGWISYIAWTSLRVPDWDGGDGSILIVSR